MSSLFSRLSAMILVLTCAGVTACIAGDRANGTLPTPAVDAPMASTGSQQTVVIAGGCLLGNSGRIPTHEGCDQSALGLIHEAAFRT